MRASVRAQSRGGLKFKLVLCFPFPGGRSHARPRWPLPEECLGARRSPTLQRVPQIPGKPYRLPLPPSLQPWKSNSLPPLSSAGADNPREREMEGTGESGVPQKAGGSGRAAVHTQSERGELSSRGDHFTGGGQQELQPPALPAVPEWRSGAAVRGEKGAGEARPAPGAGGRRQDRAPPLALTLPRCGPGGNGKAATVTSPSLGDRGTADHPPAPVGVPP